MYRVVLALKELPPENGPDAARDIAEEFLRRPHHENVRCGWDGTILTLTAENDFDSDGKALLDEFSDAISACVLNAGDGDIEVVSIEEFSRES